MAPRGVGFAGFGLVWIAADLIATLQHAAAFLPSQNPPWGASEYNMSRSTITMACNPGGWFNLSVGALVLNAPLQYCASSLLPV